MPPLSVRADLGPRSINDGERTVELIITTTNGVRRVDWNTGKPYTEVLSMDPSHVRLDRINGGAPLLDSHSAYSVADILGTVVPGSVSMTKKAMLGTVRFSKREAVQPIWEDVKDGIVRSVSVGYMVHRYEEMPAKGDAPPVRLATDWEPYEASLVPVPADANAKVRGEAQGSTNPCEIVTAGAIAAVETPQTEPAPPAEEKSEMPDNKRSETFIEQNPLLEATRQAPAPPVQPTERDAGAEAERERCQGILAACRAARLPQSFADDLISRAVSLSDARGRVLEEIGRRDPGVPTGRPARVEVVGEDPLVHARSGIANAILHRVAPDRHQLEDAGRPYRGMSLIDIGRALLSARGERVTSMSRSDLVDAMMSRGGMHGTSDFPSLLEDVAKKNLRSAYGAAQQTWLPIAQSVTLTDFKPSRQLQVGDAPALEEILEHGEFSAGTITEAKEQVQLKTYGKKFAITRAALINDDLSSFAQVPAAFGRKARDLEADLAWAQITSNPTMGDGSALFIAAHGNLSPFGQELSIGHMGDGRTAMRRQKGIDGLTPLNLSPRYLIVPAELETIADQLVTAITPAQSSNANPFGPNGRTPLTLIVEPRLDDNSRISWYMACAAADAPSLYYATLDGQTGPDLRQQDGFNVDGLEFRCRHDVAFKAADWRAIYKDPGK